MPPVEDSVDFPSCELKSWNVFDGAHRWWLRKGIPPTLGPAGTWERVIRTSALLGFMALASSWVSVFVMSISYPVIHPLSWNDLQETGPGAAFGVVVLLPLSRWMGRSWWISLLAIAISAILFRAAVVVTYGLADQPEAKSTDWAFGAFCGGLLGGVGVGACMAGRRLRSLVLFPLLAGIAAAAISAVIMFQVYPIRFPLNAMPVESAAILLSFVAIYTGFQIPAALMLGTGLWNQPMTRESTFHGTH